MQLQVTHESGQVNMVPVPVEAVFTVSWPVSVGVDRWDVLTQTFAFQDLVGLALVAGEAALAEKVVEELVVAPAPRSRKQKALDKEIDEVIDAVIADTVAPAEPDPVATGVEEAE